MKKCPFCNAEIEENARFCLYCMTPLEEKTVIEPVQKKNTRWQILATVLLFLVLMLGILLIIKNNHSKDDMQGADNVSASSEATDHRDESNSDQSSNSPSEQSNGTTQNPSSNGPSSNFPSTAGSPATSSNKNNRTDVPSSTSTAGSPSYSTGSPATSSPSYAPSSIATSSPSYAPSSIATSSPSNPSSSTTANSSSNPPSSTATSSSLNPPSSPATGSSSNTTVPTPTVPQSGNIAYTYRDATYGDDFSVGANLENAVVITGVSTVSATGEYVIPEQVEGKTVIAIMGLAFSDSHICSTVKSVVIPATVKTIWGNAFANCFNLTDIYFRGNAIYTETTAFPDVSKRNGTLTIHCSANCSDRNLRYYRNLHTYYDAEYEEWNG